MGGYDCVAFGIDGNHTTGSCDIPFFPFSDDVGFLIKDLINAPIKNIFYIQVKISLYPLLAQRSCMESFYIVNKTLGRRFFHHANSFMCLHAMNDRFFKGITTIIRFLGFMLVHLFAVDKGTIRSRT